MNNMVKSKSKPFKGQRSLCCCSALIAGAPICCHTTALTSDIVFFAVFGLLHSKGASDPADYCTDKKTKEQQEDE